MSPRVILTGANGHVGTALCLELLEHGYHVRATVRDVNDPKKTAHLPKHDRLELVNADLMDADCWAAVFEGEWDGLFQTAAVYQTESKNPQEEVIDPSIIGTLNPLRAAAAAGITRVVYTSSVAAIGGLPAGRPKTEADWQTNFSLPYTYAKVESEKRAWSLAEELNLDLRVINPSMVLGPHFARHTPSTEVVQNMLKGAYPAAPKITFGIVDVRDVASAHRIVFEADTEGRHITSTETLMMMDVGRRIKAIHPKAKTPKFTAPWLIVYLNLGMDWFFGLFGKKRTITLPVVRNMRSGDSYMDNSKLRALGWNPRPIDETLKDTIDWINLEHR
jgi:nucleoside-diphosphate-sugar epimerase